MRLFAFALWAAIPSFAASQAGLAAAMRSFGKAIAPDGPLPKQGAKPSGEALQPTGFPGLPSQDPRLPTPQPEGQRRLQIIVAEHVAGTRDFVRLTGGVHARYRGYDLFADHVEGDLRTNVFVLTGGAQLVGLDAIVKGDRIEVNFDAESFRATDGWAQIRPGFLKGRTVDDVYVWGREAHGTPREVHTHDGGLTSCNLEHPHYRLLSQTSTTRPEKRVILRDTDFELLGKTLLRIPYLSIPLDDRRERFTPEVGQSEHEGYFVKTRVGLPIAGQNDADAYLDYFSKLGVGYGGRFRYGSDDFAGYLRAYALAGEQNSLEVISEHQHQIGAATVSLSNNFQRRNFFNAPDNTTLNTRAQIVLPQGRDSTRLTYLRYNNESSTFSSLNQTWGLMDQRQFGQRTRTSLDLKWAKFESQFSSGSGSEREQVDVRIRGSHDFDKGIAELEYLRSIPVGETANFFGSSDRTPVLAFKTDSRRLLGDAFHRELPFQTELSVGEFANPAQRDRITRTFFDFSFNRPDRSSQRLGLAFGGRFRQGLYSDDTAQFALALNSTLRYRIGNDTGFNLRFSYLKPEGFTPLAIDRIGETNLVTADLSFRLVPNLLIGVQSGYDFLRIERGEDTPWQQVGVRMEWRPSREFQLRAYPYYDTSLHTWTNVRFDFAYASGETFISVGGRYDGLRHTWGQVNVYADALRFGRTKLTALAAYNGFLQQFEAIQYALVYDLHCWEAVLQVVENNVGFLPGRQVYFFFRIKAFPYQPAFGTGTRGQPIGTGTGFGY